MKLLAFDSSTETLFMALAVAGRVTERVAPGGPQASAALVPGLMDLLQQAGLALTDLDAIVFGRGPGSFTGLRTACSVAQGLGFGAQRPVVPVETLLAVAEDARERTGCVRVVAAMDARMDEVYWAGYEYAAGAWTRSTGVCLGSPEAVTVPPGWTLAGNAGAAYGDRLASPDAVRIEAVPSATALLRLAPALLAGGDTHDPADALPLYVRDKVALTTAERQTLRDAAGKGVS